MANTNTNVLPLILAQGILALRERAIMPRLVNRDHQTHAKEKGAVINIPRSSAIAARAVTPAVTFAANVDSAPTTVAVTLDQWYEAPFQMSDNDFLSVVAGFRPMQASEAIKSLGNNVDLFLAGRNAGVFNLAGTPGTTPFNASLNIAARADRKLSESLAPVEDRRAIINPAARENLILNTQVLQADQRGDAEGIIRGTIGTKLGFDWYMDQNITAVTYTPGTGWGSGNIASTVAGAVGDTTLNIINATASGQIKIGDIFTLTADTASRQYVVTVTTTISATVQRTITFYPALKSAVATGATLIVVSVAHTRNLAFHRDAWAFASRPLQQVMAVSNIFQGETDPVSGIALRLELSRQYKQDTYSFDILYGGNLVVPEYACIIAGEQETG